MQVGVWMQVVVERSCGCFQCEQQLQVVAPKQRQGHLGAATVLAQLCQRLTLLLHALGGHAINVSKAAVWQPTCHWAQQADHLQAVRQGGGEAVREVRRGRHSHGVW